MVGPSGCPCSPSGEVNFALASSTDGSASLSSAPCTLVPSGPNADCSVGVTGIELGPIQMTARYQGDKNPLPSSQTVFMDVYKDGTTICGRCASDRAHPRSSLPLAVL